MKLSPLKVGSVLSFKSKTLRNYYFFYIVLTDTIQITKPVDKEDEIIFFSINAYKLFGESDIKFPLCRITPQEVLDDEYPLPNWNITPYNIKNLPLLINEPNKTKWFERALNTELRGHGNSLYKLLNSIITDSSSIKGD